MLRSTFSSLSGAERADIRIAIRCSDRRGYLTFSVEVTLDSAEAESTFADVNTDLYPHLEFNQELSGGARLEQASFTNEMVEAQMGGIEIMQWVRPSRSSSQRDGG